jgi:hypothetical protein
VYESQDYRSVLPDFIDQAIGFDEQLSYKIVPLGKDTSVWEAQRGLGPGYSPSQLLHPEFDFLPIDQLFLVSFAPAAFHTLFERKWNIESLPSSHGPEGCRAFGESLL